MRRRSLLTVVAGIGSLAAGLVSVPAATAAAPTPHLVRVDVFQPAAAAGNGHGRPVPTTGNCSPDDGSTTGEYSTTGWSTTAQTARLIAATVPTTIVTAATSGGTRTTATTNDVLNAMRDGFTDWSSGTPAPSIGVTLDNSSTQTKQVADRVDELLFARVSGSAIAVTYTWRWTDGKIESDTLFSAKLAWAIIPDDTTSAHGCYPSWPMYDVENIATHEFGHTYGLGHAQSDRFETMYVYGYTGETLKRTRDTGDTAGINSIY